MFNKSWTKLTILNSDMLTVNNWHDKINCLVEREHWIEKGNNQLEKQVENWTMIHAGLEETKRILYEEMMEEMQREIDLT